MKAELYKSGRGWLPADEEARALHERMGVGEIAVFNLLRPRSVQWHRLYFSLCRTIGQNQDPQRDEDSIDAEIRILAGHYDVLKIKGGVEVLVPKRIAFDKMDADGWRDYWQRAEAAIIQRFGEEYIARIAA